ncbi:hypothetical protein BH10ACT1_BH10ACT1_39920 [soil metagenome]
MGFFKDLNTVQKQAKELGRNSDPGAKFAEMNQKMAALNHSMAQQAATLSGGPADAMAATVQVVAAVPTGGSVNGEPTMAISVLVLAPGRPPLPATATLPVPGLQLHRLQPGATLAARVGASDPSIFAIDWAAPS